ncbi:MAG: serine hydrolase domain-containing protein [Bacteroidota bacterium]
MAFHGVHYMLSSMILLRKITLLLCFCSGSFFLHAQKITPEITQKIDGLFSAWEESEMPGGVIGIVENGELVWSKAYGMASLEYDVPNTTETIFNIASVSKQITAFSMVLLEQQGKLSLDDEVRKHLKEMPDFGKKITIRQLLHHTSGLRNFQNMLSMAGWRSGESMTNEDLLRYLSQQRDLNFDPGAEYLYCNTGFNIVTAIVERITGQSFQDWTQENIFQPLGMTNSSYREDLERIHKNTATSYDGDAKNGFEQPLKYWTYMGNGNVYTTVDDLTKWMNNFRNPTLGGKEGIEKLVTPGVLKNGEELTYGLGIWLGENSGVKRYSHGGSVGGYRSNMVYFPEQDKGIILITNFSTANPGGKVFAIADMILADVVTPRNNNASSQSNKIERKAVTFNQVRFQDFVGKYFVDGVIVELSLDAGVPKIFAQGQLPAPIPLTPSSDTTFFSEAIGLDLMLAGNGEDIRMQVMFQGDRNRGFKIAQFIPSAALTGVYYSPELDTRYTVFEEDGRLMVKHPRHETFELIPRNDRLYATAYFFNDVEVVKAGELVAGFRVSNGRVRNMWFAKVE